MSIAAVCLPKYTVQIGLFYNPQEEESKSVTPREELFGICKEFDFFAGQLEREAAAKVDKLKGKLLAKSQVMGRSRYFDVQASERNEDLDKKLTKATLGVEKIHRVLKHTTDQVNGVFEEASKQIINYKVVQQIRRCPPLPLDVKEASDDRIWPEDPQYDNPIAVVLASSLYSDCISFQLKNK